MFLLISVLKRLICIQVGAVIGAKELYRATVILSIGGEADHEEQQCLLLQYKRFRIHFLSNQAPAAPMHVTGNIGVRIPKLV